MPKKLTRNQKKALGLKKPVGLSSYAQKHLKEKALCPKCHGRGQTDGEKCGRCQGTGMRGNQNA